MIPRPKELEWWPGPKIADKSLDVNQCSDVGLEFLGPAHEKAARRSVPPNEKAGCFLEDRATSPVLHTNRR